MNILTANAYAIKAYFIPEPEANFAYNTVTRQEILLGLSDHAGTLKPAH